MSTGSAATSRGKRWAGRTGSERIAERRSKLVRAGVDILVRHGAQGVTVRAVHRAAGLSSRYFYESFTDREELLRAVFDDVFDDIAAVIRAAMNAAEADFRSQARASLDGTVRAIDGDVPAAATLMRESLGEATLHEHARTRLAGFVLDTGLAALAEQIPDPDEAVTQDWVRPTVTAVAGATVVMHLERIEGRLAMPREQYVDHVFNAVTGIVTATMHSGQTVSRRREPQGPTSGSASSNPASQQRIPGAGH